MERIEDHNHIVVNDDVLPSQFYPARSSRFTAERTLWANVLLDAINCVQKCREAFISAPTSVVGSGNHNRRRKRGLEDQAWFDDNNDISPGSFLFVCDALDLHPDDIRTAIAQGIRIARRSPVDFAHHISASKHRVRYR